MPTEFLLSAQDVSLEINKRRVLDHISLQILEQQIVTLIGPNGAGKTSLVKILLGLQAPSSGQVKRHRNLSIGYMPQRLQVEASMPITVRKFLQLALRRHSPSLSQACEQVGAEGLLDNQLHSLSGGEFQRVLLARALLQRPQLLVLDEPAQGVDINGQAELYELIGRIRDEYRCSVLMVSHDLHLVMSATDEVLCLNQHICCHGHPEQVSNDPAYLELFGRRQAENLAVYTHNHNHHHTLDGDIIEPEDRHG